jgi:dihydroorotase
MPTSEILPPTRDSPSRLVLRRPDDMHVHLRDGAMLARVAPFTARQFARAVVMPNLDPPLTSRAAATAYRGRILETVGADAGFTPLMTCYLTDASGADEIVRGHAEGIFFAAKLYPAHATTNAEHGVTDIGRITPVLEAMQKAGMPLLLHGEVTDPTIDIFDREAVFIDRVLARLVVDFPDLKIVIEHITTRHAVDFVLESTANLAATITPHHLQINRNALFEGGIRPHFYCLPVAKREQHRLALRRAATSGSPKFFLGTDTAPHTLARKQSACGCAGIFNAPFAIECYAQVFDEEGALGRLQGFAAEQGARFYGLPLNQGEIVLERQAVQVPPTLQGPDDSALMPFRAGEFLPWRLAAVIPPAAER